MAKTTKQPDAVTVRYDLHGLPSAQHKAGLAGLLLQIENMNDRRTRGADLAAPPEVVEQGPAFAEVKFTAASIRALFDDLYAATYEPIWVDNKWQNRRVLDQQQIIDRKTGKLKKQFQYEICVPTGRFLKSYTDGLKEKWHKLWRETFWSTSRLKPKALEKKFGTTAKGNASPDGLDAWRHLLDYEQARGQPATIPADTAVMLNVQKFNAEGVKFEDRAELSILLHFWQLVVRIFVPEVMASDGKSKFVGYVLAIPEPTHLSEFCRAYKHDLSFLQADAPGYRPKGAIIALPAEGPLSLMRSLDRLATQRTLGRRPADYLSAVEFFHYLDRDAKGKKLRDPKIATHGRVPAWDGLLTRYDGLMSKGGPKNPLMLAGRIRALLADAPWFLLLADDLIEREWSWFVHSVQDRHATPRAMIGFARDARHRFEQLLQEKYSVTQPQDPEEVDRVVYRLVKQYVRERASARLGVSTSDGDAWHRATHDTATGYERPAYQEERRHVAQGLFLALRSRRDTDFVEHFTATLGSVAQRLPEEDYAVLAAALLRTFTDEHGERRPRTREDVKTLTLLALSANSRSLTAKANETENEVETDEPVADDEQE